MILIFLIAELLSFTPSSGSVDGLYLEFQAPSTVSSSGFTSYEIDGCSGMDDVHLPVRYVRLPIEPGTTPQVRVEVTGTRSIGPSAGVASSFFTEDGTEAFREASSALLPDQWSRVVQYGTWRRAGFVEVALYPVTARGGELQCASGMRVVVEGQGASVIAQGFGSSGPSLRSFLLDR